MSACFAARLNAPSAFTSPPRDSDVDSVYFAGVLPCSEKPSSVAASFVSEIAVGVAGTRSSTLIVPPSIATWRIVRSSGGAAFAAAPPSAFAPLAAATVAPDAPDAPETAAADAAGLPVSAFGAAAGCTTSFSTFSTPCLSRDRSTTGWSSRISSKCIALRSGSRPAAATCTPRAANSGADARSVTFASFRSTVPDTRSAGVSPLITKLTVRLLLSRPLVTATGSFAGTYEISFGTSSRSNFSAISDSRDCANGLVLPSIEIGLPSKRARSFGSTKMSVFEASVAMYGMPSVQWSTTCFSFSRRSSKSIRPSLTWMFDTENCVGLLSGVGDGDENFSIRSVKLKRCAS